MTKTEDIFGKVNSIIYDKLIKRNVLPEAIRSFFRVYKKEATLKSNFKNDLGADSLDMVVLIMEFEKEFSIKITDEEAEKIRTVAEAVECIRKKIEQKIIKEGI
jgi:acyl carrier protein